MIKILIIIYFMKTHCNHYTIICQQLVRVELTQCTKGHFHSITIVVGRICFAYCKHAKEHSSDLTSTLDGP